MANPADIAAVTGDLPTFATRRKRGRFFVFMSAVMLVVVLFGFGPSFYLRPLYEMPAETPIVFVHAGFMTAWFVLLLVQTALVSADRVSVHRNLGVLGVAVASIAVVLNIIVTLEFGARMAASGNLARSPSIIWGNFATLSVFAVCVALAVWYRKRPDTHRHLMLLASISMTPPAWTRIPIWWPALRGIINPVTGVIVLVAVLVVYDLVSRRGLRVSTIVGGASLIALILLSSLVASSEFGIAFVEGLG